MANRHAHPTIDRGLAILVGLLISMLSGVGMSYAQAGGAQEPPPGTVITTQDWQNYKQFMTIPTQKIFEGTDAVKLPADATIVVGPYVSIPPPRKYQQDTEHYAGTVTLKELPTGGFVPQNYVVGNPFPNPTEPNKGVKILYDMYYNYKPWLMYRKQVHVMTMDKYGHLSESDAFQVIVRMAHISDVGMPTTLPNGLPGIFLSQYLEAVSPEESKYAANLTLFPDDPSKDEEVFLYIPTLRRSLRSSSASRCAPLLGSDSFNDDLNGGFNGIPSEFHIESIEEGKKILWIMPMAMPNPPYASYFQTNFWFPKPIVGTWALRPVHVLQVTPIDSVLPGYCYPKKIIYLDKQTFQIAGTAVYDKSGQLWKGTILNYYPLPIPDSPGDQTYNSFLIAAGTTVDFQNSHWSPSALFDATMLGDVPTRYRNLECYATPGGLDQIMQ